MVIVEPADFVWVSCPDSAYFVKPALFHGKGGKWQDSKLKSIRRLQKQDATGVEIVPHFSGAYYYVGTYTVGEAEPMSAEQFEQLPEKVRIILYDFTDCSWTTRRSEVSSTLPESR